MKKIMSVFMAMLFALLNVAAQNNSSSKNDMARLIEEQFNFAAQQYKVLNKNVPADVMPKTFNAKKNKVETSDTKWWCSGFFPGSLLYIYELTKNPEIKAAAEQRLAILEKEKHYTGNHDLGFMMYCSFGNAYRLFRKPEDKTTIDTSAASLATRYRPSIKSIQSWDKNENFECPVIIDNMMNLELLNWVSDHGGDSRYKEIATRHANSTILNHYRPDNSAYHVLDYDLASGKVARKKNWQGAFDSSAWARGQSWGLYGFTTMYRDTKDKRYLQQAQKIARFLLSHPNLPEDKIPYWDYNAPNIPNTLRDASAGAVMASALLELGQYVKGKEKTEYVGTAEKIIRSLSSATYRSKLGENGGFILMHSVGFFNANSEVDQPLTYADYYFLEAMKRYKAWYL